MQYAILGATGFIGKALVKRLLDGGHGVLAFARDPGRAKFQIDSRARLVQWPSSGRAAELAGLLDGSDGVINLAGENVGKGRWTARRKQELVESRTHTTAYLVDAMALMQKKPEVFVCASAVGIYGDRGDEIVDESSSPGTGFLVQLCEEWERVARGAEAHGIRVVRVRISLVFGRDEGAFPMMVMPFKFFAGGPLGSGEQWVSWIHIEDMVRLLEFAATSPDAKGALNAAAPDAERLKDLMRIVGHVMRRPSWISVPAFVLKAAMGEQAEILLGGCRAKPVATLAAGFRFNYPDAASAVRNLLG